MGGRGYGLPDLDPFVDRVGGGLQYREPPTQTARLVVVVDQDWARGVSGQAVGSQAGDFEGAPPCVAQDDICGQEHVVRLLGCEDSVGKSAPQ